MRRCQDFQEAMPHYLNGQLDPAAAGALDRHLADCPRCLDSMAEELIKTYQEAADRVAPRAFATTGSRSALR